MLGVISDSLIPDDFNATKSGLSWVEGEVGASEGGKRGRGSTKELESMFCEDENFERVESSSSTNKFELRAQTDRGVSDALLNLRSAWNDRGRDGSKDDGGNRHIRCSDSHALRSSLMGLRSGLLAASVRVSVRPPDASERNILLAV